MKLYKYHGGGNDFLILDGRDGQTVSPDRVRFLCDRHLGFGADGLMVLRRPLTAGSASGNPAFGMDYYNADGSGGMMCGNGGRCIVAFAADLGYTRFDFEGPDGPHQAGLLADDGVEKTVRLRMKDVSLIRSLGGDAWFLDTGTRHYVRPVGDLTAFDVVREGRQVRYDPAFAPEGVNANFIEADPDGCLHVRTYEKGVEDETLACGTGIVASALAAYALGRAGRPVPEDPAAGPAAESGGPGRIRCDIQARISRMTVDFVPGGPGEPFARDIWLTGPATFVGTLETPED